MSVPRTSAVRPPNEELKPTAPQKFGCTSSHWAPRLNSGALARRTMKRPEREVEVAASVETESRRREVQLLINVAEPDPAYQPFIAYTPAVTLL